MTEYTPPSVGTLVELTPAEQPPVCGVRVVAADQDELTMSLAQSDVPAVGTAVTLRWPAGVRGRYVLAATVVSVDENRIQVTATGSPGVEQNRNFVRGGGGEHVLLRRPGQPDVVGWIRDISEQGVRAHFADVDVHAGETIRLHVQLDAELVEADAVVLKVESLQQSVPQRGSMSVEMVAVLSCAEMEARVIRRYVLRQQLLTRTRTG
jgi:hypothetical protein